MIRTFVNSYRVTFAESANQFIYFLKRIPLLGKKVSDQLYGQTDAKQVIGIITEILGVFGGFLKKSMYLGILMILPAYLMTKDISKISPLFFHIYFFLSLVLGPLMRSTFFNKQNKNAFNMITLMRADAKEYYLGEIIFKNLTDFMYFIVPIVIIGVIIGFSPLKALVLIIELIALRFAGEWLQIWVYNKKKIILMENKAYNFILYTGTLLLAYVLLALDLTIDFAPFLFNAFIVIVILCLGAAAFLCLWRYEEYAPIAKSILNKDNLYRLGSIKTDMQFGNVKLNEKKMSKEDLSTKRYNKKVGYEYLNFLFFLRHRRIMVTPIKIRVAIIGVLFLAGMVVVFFVPEYKVIMLNQIPKSTHILVFLMYFMSTGQRICKAMFFNCDVSLLRYSYYREGKVILSNYTARLKKVVLLNIIPAVAMCLALLIIVIAGGSGSKLGEMLPLFLCILCLSCFFSIHHLFLYYAIQPYTAELTVNSPLFKVINAVVYIVSYACLQIEASSYYFTIGVIFTTAVYMVAALITTYKVAPGTFRLR
jgi:hypothetical protein